MLGEKDCYVPMELEGHRESYERALISKEEERSAEDSLKIEVELPDQEQEQDQGLVSYKGRESEHVKDQTEELPPTANRGIDFDVAEEPIMPLKYESGEIDGLLSSKEGL